MATVIEQQSATEHWLQCQVDKGMFSDEMAVTYPPEGAMQKSVFVEKKSVRGSAGDRGKVRVKVIMRDGKMLAVLPSPTQDIVYVQAGDISEE